jgi:hypothetical protein
MNGVNATDFKESDVEAIVRNNAQRIRGIPSNSILMPDDIYKIMTKSIYDSICKYHESVNKPKR